MRSFNLIFVTLMLSGSLQARAANCEAVLIPTVEQSRSDYSMMQAFMKMHASSEYERLKKMNAEGRSADGSYKLFSAEYEESRSSSEFQEKINKRLSQESFNQSEAQAKATSRRYLGAAQIDAWSKCVMASGSLLLVPPPQISGSAFNLRIEWRPQHGIGNGRLSMTLRGGTIEGRDKIDIDLLGSTNLTKIVDISPGSSSILVAANVTGGNTDGIDIALRRSRQRAFTFDGDTANALDGVKVPTRADESIRYGSDTLADRIDGSKGVSPNGQLRTAEWSISSVPPGRYWVAITFAAATARPLRLLLDNRTAAETVANEPTGGWDPSNRIERTYGPISIPSGSRTMRLETRTQIDSWPHFRQLRLFPAD